MKTAVISKIKNAPKFPGIYIFYKGAKPLYVGKAVNLKNRLASYLKENGDSKNVFLQKEADRLVLRRLSSGIKALIVESQLIKKLRPVYNVLMADDKSYFYVMFTHSTSSGQAREKFPRIFITHKVLKASAKGGSASGGKSYKLTADLIGPFTDGQSLKIVLRALRRILPYCACKASHFRFCLNSQIGNCPGFCCKLNANLTRLEVVKYRKNITAIKNFLLGKRMPGKLQKELEQLANDKLAAFENIRSHGALVQSYETKSRKIAGNLFERAEAYDISHLSGKEAVGAMTAWIKKNGVWEADKSGWRKFKIKTAPKSDDPRAIAEIISRRFNHPEWPFPDLVIIDGGLTQLNAAKKSINNLNPKSHILNHKIISFAKPHKLIYGLSSEPLKLEEVSSDLTKLVQKAIYYTHNFAIRYHRSLRNKL